MHTGEGIPWLSTFGRVPVSTLVRGSIELAEKEEMYQGVHERLGGVVRAERGSGGPQRSMATRGSSVHGTPDMFGG